MRNDTHTTLFNNRTCKLPKTESTESTTSNRIRADNLAKSYLKAKTPARC